MLIGSPDQGVITSAPSFERTPRGDIIAPHWAYVLFFVVTATTPWLRWRFSLRTLVIATTLVAVVLGLVVWAVR